MDYPARLERLVAIQAGDDAILRLAALAVVLREDAERLRERLRLSNAEYERLAAAAALRERLHGRGGAFAPQELTEMLFLHGRRCAADALALAHADSANSFDHPGWRAAARFVAEVEAPFFPVKGADLLALGVAPGQALGQTLKRLQANWIRAGFPQDPRHVLQLLSEVAPEE